MTTLGVGTLSFDDFILLSAGLCALRSSEVDGEAIHLEAGPTGRRWMVDSQHGQLRIQRSERPEPGSFQGYLPISDRLRHIAGCLTDETIELAVADDDALVVTSGPNVAVIDLVERATGFPTEIEMRVTARATVPMRHLLAVLTAARMMPTGVSFDSYPAPPMWMQIAGDDVGLYVDWFDHLPSRTTFRTAATAVEGTATVAIPHCIIESFLRTLPTVGDDGEDLTMEVSVGSSTSLDDRPLIRLAGPQWSIAMYLPDPLGDRWGDRVRQVLDDAALPVVDETEAEWVVSSMQQEVRVKLHAGRPDVVRVSGVLLYPAVESVELLRELSQLNAGAIGVRFWLDDEAVRAAADVPCMHLDGLPFAVSSVAQAMRNLAPMIAAFATA
jgi:hypothetical protein